jgi:hypothetical protein
VPKILNIEYTSKITSRTLSPGRAREIMRNAMRRANYSALQLYEGTVATWDHKPKFKEHVSIQANYIEARVGVDLTAETSTAGSASTNYSGSRAVARLEDTPFYSWYHSENVEAAKPRPTAEEVYRFVDEGTDPHIIPLGGSSSTKVWRGLQGEIQFNLRKGAEPNKTLRFKSGGYAPKTSPNTLAAGPGSPGEFWVNADEVHHPGIEARKFTKRIAEWSFPDYKEEARRGMAQVAKEIG